ncbi:MAG TPA: hypothetical protein VGD10_06650 [Allosphingosinicella sp.]|uniref:hypothetical protein n=1 Tax=Allosphingosinicella sp. TaxID=2823234 RepID=UPI002EDB28C6
MDLLKALLIGFIIAVAVPMVFGGPTGAWMSSAASVGTISPLEGSPGLLFSIPLFVGATVIFWIFFEWHSR